MSETTPNSNPSSTSKFRLLNTVDVPRGGWSYVVAATGVRLNAGSLTRLQTAVRSHYGANRLAIPPGLEADVADMACRGLGVHVTHWCTDSVAPKSHVESRWQAADVRRFLKTIVAWGAKTGFAFVDDAEAARRAAICAACPLNVQVSGCLGCSGVARLVNSVRAHRVTPHDAKLHACDACGCELKVKVLLPLDVINNDGVEYPANCWQHSPEDPVERPHQEL